MPSLRGAIDSARRRGVLPAFSRGSMRDLARKLALPAPVSVRNLIRTLEARKPPTTPKPPPTPQPPPPATAQIGVELAPGPGAFENLRVFGSGFAREESVDIVIASRSRFGDGRESSAGTTAEVRTDKLGQFSLTVSTACPDGAITTIEVRAQGRSSSRLSNVASASC